jgi:hypothetical protein
MLQLATLAWLIEGIKPDYVDMLETPGMRSATPCDVL